MSQIFVVGGSEPVRFAARELARYLKRMTGRAVRVVRGDASAAGSPGFWIGVAADLGPAVAGNAAALAADAPDDAVCIRARGQHVVLTGPNPRSVLFSVYRYLEELGCRWLRPGNNGERVPRRRALPRPTINLLEVASYRHRCVCIEGSCSVDHVRNLIDYAAKRGLNAYFTQFRNSYTFFDRWYGLEKNRRPVRTRFTSAEATATCEAVKRAALRRGLMLHVVGHGWTCEPFGIAGEEWAPTRQKISATGPSGCCAGWYEPTDSTFNIQR